MQLRFLGAAREVTGSLLLLETAGRSLVIDCGLFQGRRKEARERNRMPPRFALDADAAILTHAHIDHSGNLPTLVKGGFSGRIYATPATTDLCSYMLRDCAKIALADAEYLNKKNADDPDWEPIAPLYTEEDVEAALKRFEATPIHKNFRPLPNINARFLDAGHILGSVQVVLDIEEDGIRRRLVISGDLGRNHLPVIRDPDIPDGPIDYLVMESTYGNRTHNSVESMHTDLERVVKEAFKTGGKIVVPAFAVGRTQELLFVLNNLHQAGRLPPIPVFVDSPLAINVTEVFRQHAECYDDETFAFQRAHGDAFVFPGVTYLRSKEESMSLNAHRGPAMIISAAGMAEAGRVLHHLKNLIEDERNTILIVGFMAQHTLGRKIAERHPQVKIWGVERELRAKVEVLTAFSAHTDRPGLLSYAEACAPSRGLFLVHGEPDQQEPLAQELTRRGLIVHRPVREQQFHLD